MLQFLCEGLSAKLVTDDEVLGGWVGFSFFESGGGCLPATMGFLANRFPWSSSQSSAIRFSLWSSPNFVVCFGGIKKPLASPD